MQIYKIYPGLQNFSSLLIKYCREVGAMRGLARQGGIFLRKKGAYIEKNFCLRTMKQHINL